MTSAQPPAHTQLFLGPTSGDAVDLILARFRSGTALVAAALTALDALAPHIAAIAASVPAAPGSSPSDDLRASMVATHNQMVDIGSIDGETLLQRDENRPGFLVLGLARAASGKLSVQPIEIDRGQIALIDAGKGPWDVLRETIAGFPQDPREHDLRDLRTALAAVDARIAIARSRLSIIKTRLDLQSSFLSAIVESEPASAVVRLDSPLDQSGAHHMALQARRLLAGRSFTIGNTNRAAVRTLFERHASKIA